MKLKYNFSYQNLEGPSEYFIRRAHAPWIHVLKCRTKELLERDGETASWSSSSVFPHLSKQNVTDVY